MTKPKLIIGWCALGAGLLIWAGLLFRLSARFSYAFEVPDMPIRTFVALLASGGVLFSLVVFLVHKSLTLGGSPVWRLLGFIFLVGLGLRLILIFSEPMLEDDYQRYLWDGAQVVHGLNPYAMSPFEARSAPRKTLIGTLAAQSGPILGRINHGELRTVYPPVAQLFFGLAHIISPFDLMAWRGIILVIDLGVLGLLYLILSHIGRSPLWLSLYWLNPIVAKEFYNSAHMDILIAPFILGALYLALKGRVITPLIALAFGVGVKIWPVFFVPLVLRNAWSGRGSFKNISVGLFAFVLLCGAWAWPILLAGFGEGSGFAAYASKWQTNSALFPALEGGIGVVLHLFDVDGSWAGRLARLVVLGLLGLLSLLLARDRITGGDDLVLRGALLALAILLLSPAQFPWYLTWFAPFLVFLPLSGIVILHITIPFYYLGFYYFSVDDYSFYTNVIVWLVWLPVWGLLVYEMGWVRKFTRDINDYTAQFMK